jgi:GABA permease
MVERLRGTGLDVTAARIGDPDALAAACDQANAEAYDEVVISTLPLHLSKWLRVDLPRKVEHATGLPVTHVVAHEPKAVTGG